MVEIKGFNEAYKAMLAKETVKKIHKKHTDNRVKELIAQGVDKEIAKVMASVGLEDSRNGKGQPPRAVKTGRQPVF